ncbi:MAG: rubrerythrin family protein [Candidatus Omnitrophica bacterium]|nr:rubrerythrin family protein [Candidatus Omnitrophota bacterium]
MKKMSEKVLGEAFCGESMAHMKYLAFSEVAEKEGFKNISRLFKAISYAEQVHATNHAKTLGYIGNTKQNLQAGIDGETYEVEEMYPSFDAVVNLQGEEKAHKSIHYALEAEKIHKELYKEALDKIKENKDIDLDEIYICPVCGYTHIGTPPSTCPVCNISSKEFKKF